MRMLRWISVLLCLLASLGWAQEAPALGDWEQQWNDLYAREDLSSGERLASQTELVKAAGPLVGWRDARVWDWTRQVLSGWESSADLEAAYAAYLSLLDLIGKAVATLDQPLPDESALRDFYQRALTIARTPAEEGRLLFYLAESVLRSSPDTHETRRRAEAYLQQAALSLSDEPPMDAVQFRLAELYRGWDSISDEVQEDEDSYLSRVVFHYRYIQGMSSAREPYLAAAAAALEELLSPGLDLQVANRFLPENDIRISINSRNLPQVTLEVYSLPWKMQEYPVSHARMQVEWLAGEPAAETLVFSKSLPVTSRQRYDWEEHEFRLGENFTSGWYWVRVTGGELMDQDLMLVTPLELSVIPRSPDLVSVWVVDAESGHPVPNAAYQVLGLDGQLLTSGICDANGLAHVEIQGGADWTEIHVTDGMSPALVRKEDLENGPEPISPWIIPGSTEVEPGGILEWMVLAIDGLPTEGVDSIRVRLPDGSRLAGSLSRIGPHALIGRVTIPQTASIAGPVYLEMPGGDHVMVSHLKTVERFPLSVDISGERYSEGANLFLSSAPLAVRIFSNATTDQPIPDYLRVRITAFDRKAYFPKGEFSTDSKETVVLENIYKFGVAESGNTHFDLPDIDADGDLLILRIEVYALDSSELIGQAYLALLPYRTLVGLKLSEQLVSQGDTVEVNFSLTKAEESSPRAFEGELVVFRESWESRYIHRKKGTLLSEADYLALPDRSLLGAAKTDYRLLEQGFVREEISRIAVNVDQLSTIPIKLDRAGYYHIEFEGREMETRANYPDGPMEVWVIPDSTDLRAFHSEKPRLITEYGVDG
ncbi:MAG TPA: hypothetical protein VK995_01840, partial [Oceanipulchritudo sp.]|nr:hypothetical protein [Oceanipulchritudo sp.]